MKVGVLGGFGPESTSEFYMRVIDKNRKLGRSHHPDILIHNAPVPFKIEEDVVKNAKNVEKLLPLLINSVNLLRDRVDFIVIPCNTVHVFIEKLRSIPNTSIVSIVEETVREIKLQNIKKVGLLATPETIKEKLYEEKLAEDDIQTIVPSKRDQKKIASLIHLVLKGLKTEEMETNVLQIINKLIARGAEGIILGCTELPLLVNDRNCSVKLFDTLDVLVKSTLEKMR